MPENLEKLIAQVAIKAAAEDGCSSITSELIAAAVKVSAHVTPSDVARFASLWYPL